MIAKNMKRLPEIIGRLDHASDLLESLTDIVVKNNVRAGKIQAIGALYNAHFGFYDSHNKSYIWIDVDKHVELVSLMGNISIKDGKPFVHAHIAVADEKGATFGGHLGPGNKVFACEYIISPYDGELVRKLDSETNLPLW